MRWLLRILLAVLAWRLLKTAIQPSSRRPSGPRIDPEDESARVKSRGRARPDLDGLTPHPIEDAEFEELPRGDR
jgi:hypothetical protein